MREFGTGLYQGSPMKTKATQSRSINIRLSVRTMNDLENFLSEQEATGSAKLRSRAALLRRRLDRAPRLKSR
jgi:hypothetical protein